MGLGDTGIHDFIVPWIVCQFYQHLFTEMLCVENFSHHQLQPRFFTTKINSRIKSTEPSTAQSNLIYSRWWFQIFCIFTPILGEIRSNLTSIFFKWVEACCSTTFLCSLSQVTVDPPLEHPTSDLAVTSEADGKPCGFYDARLDPRTWDCNTLFFDKTMHMYASLSTLQETEWLQSWTNITVPKAWFLFKYLL